MILDDIEIVQRVEQAAGELFRPLSDPRISACADHPPTPAEALVDFVAAGGAWVATADDVVVGFLAAKVVGGCGHVQEVAVLPEWNGRGVGSALLARAVAWTVRGGGTALTLTTFRDVPWNRPFYERRGFRILGDDELDEAHHELVIEEQRLGLARELRVVMRRDLPTPVAVRDATGDDLPVITDLFNALIPTTTIAWRDDLADETEMATWFAAQQHDGNPVLVAEADGNVVGYATWSWFRGGVRYPGYRHTRELTIHVDGGHHGQGVGRTLIEVLVERARSDEVRVLVAGVDAANEASIVFHERMGFEQVANMPGVGRKFERWLDLVLLQRTIDDPR